MMVCSKCSIEMRCTRSGVMLLWNSTHARSGDEYKCPQCGNKSIHANDESYTASMLSVEASQARNRLMEMKT